MSPTSLTPVSPDLGVDHRRQAAPTPATRPARLVVFTQDERVYLPLSMEPLFDALAAQIECVVLSPPMSTHGGALKGLVKHLPVFGLKGTASMGARVIGAKLAPRLGLPPSGRQAWSIEELAERRGIPVHHVERVNSPAMHAVLERYRTDLLVSVSCPQIVKREVLERFRLGGINVHSSPLPRYRGLMPGFWVLYHDEPETAVTVHAMADKLDDGDILVQRPVPIWNTDSWHTLVTRTKRAAGSALVEAVRGLEADSLERRPNPVDESSYFSFPTWKHARDFRRRGKRMF